MPLRFLSSFEDWIKENTRGVFIIQIRDRKAGGWEMPYDSKSISDHATKPFLLLQLCGFIIKNGAIILSQIIKNGLGGMLSGIKFSLSNMKGNLIMTPDNAQAFERSIDMLDSSIRD